MRILIVANPFIAVPPKKYGGTERVIYFLIKGLVELGHEPILIGAGDSKVPCRLIESVPMAIFYPKRPMDLPRFNVQVKLINRKIGRLIKENITDVDIVHSHGYDLKRFQYHPNLTTLHGPIMFEHLKNLLSRSREGLCYSTISNNQQIVLPQLNFAGTVYNGLDTSDFPIVTEPEDYVCFVGRFDREKNPHLAI